MITPKPLLTTRELADAIGASESSLRRWIDSGDIRVARTAGGHRRIALSDAIAFVRRIGATVVRPDVLGLGEPRTVVITHNGVASNEQMLLDALISGNLEAARSLVISWYLDGQALSEIFDGPMRQVLAQLGDRWKHDAQSILLEHSATAACIEIIALLRSLLPSPGSEAPLAIGGAASGDPYLIPSQMVAAVLAEAGWRVTNYGPGTPTELLNAAAVERGAKMVWLSISSIHDAKSMRENVRELARALKRQNVALIIGGRYASETGPGSMSNVRVAASMANLAEIAREIANSNKAPAMASK